MVEQSSYTRPVLGSSPSARTKYQINWRASKCQVGRVPAYRRQASWPTKQHYTMKEIEVKAKLEQKQEVIEKLKNLGCVFNEPVTQKDVVYVKNIGSLEIFKSNDIFLRIRTINNSKILFTVKKRMVNDLDALEYETEISSKEEMEQALLLMGYKEAIRINKSRLTTHYQNYEIDIDEVDNLGEFIEVEKLAEDGNSEQIQNELFNILISLGIKPENRVIYGYDILMLNQNTNITL